MEDLNLNYKLSTYIEVGNLSKGKIYIVRSSIDDKIYIKKILEVKNQNIYEKIKELSIANTPKIYEIFKLEDKVIVIEEYINGNTLNKILEDEANISPQKAIKYSLSLIEIINKMHSCKPPIIHKDINPANIMINNDGILKLIDFDISRMYSENKNTDTHILGTHGYAAPEQFGFDQTDARTDIYSLGVTINTMLVGKFPNEEKYKGELSKIISKCIEMDPSKRYQNVNELKADLLKLDKKREKPKADKINIKLPGFRSGNPIYKILASSWYLLLIVALSGVLDKEHSFKNMVMNIEMVLFLFSLTLLYGNYNDIHSKLLLLRSSRFFIKTLGYLVYTLFILMILGMVYPT